MKTATINQTASLRFQTLIAYALKYLDSQHSNAYGIALMCFDGVTVKHLHSAIQAKPYLTQEGICISWKTEIGRIYRIILSPMTVSLYFDLKDYAHKPLDQKEFDSLYRNLNGTNASLKSTCPYDQLSWLKEITNGPLFAHFSDVSPMSGLLPSAYARLDKRLALSDLESVEGELEAEQTLAEVVAGFVERDCLDRDSAIVSELKDACRLRGDSDSARKRRMLSECLKLSSTARHYGPTASLLVAWAISLITHGTRQVLAPKTINDYVSLVAMHLYNSFKGLDISTLDSEAFQTIYQQIKDESSKANKKSKGNKSAAALSSFHSFLVYWLDVPASGRLNAEKDLEHVPVSNVIWPHEVELIMEWLNQASCDARLLSIWRIGLLLGMSKRIRIGELFDIRLEDIERIGNKLVIHVRGQKTKASKRDIVIADGDLYHLISDFLDRRRIEFANDDDFLFGDPIRPGKIYKFGQLYYGFNTLLKAVTGDRSASFHWLSHSVISFGLTSLLSDKGDKQINPFAQFATDSAHFSIDTTCAEYMHLYHIPIRRLLDHALSKINLTSEIVCKWVGIKANTIRKRISNHGLSMQSYYWNLMLHSAVSPHTFLSQGDLIETSKPHAPEFLCNESALDFEKVFHVLADMVADKPKESILLKNGIRYDEFKSIQTVLESVLQKHGLAEEFKLDEHDSLTELDLRLLTKHGFAFKLPQKKYTQIFRYFSKLKRHQAAEQLHGCKAWAALKGHLKSSYLSLSEKYHCDHFLSLMKAAQLDITRVAVFYAPSARQNSLHMRVGEKFISYFGRRPCFYEVKEHNGRPNVYLALCDVVVNPDKAPYGSATSMAGFHSILLAALVWIGCASCNQ